MSSIDNRTVCEIDMCSGCQACLEVCPNQAITLCEELRVCNAQIDIEKCLNCGACRAVCQQNHPAKQQAPVLWLQGWALDEEIRARGSSGGAAGAVSQAFIREGGIVCSCTFEKGHFRFRFAEKTEDLEMFSGSKYVKSSPQGILMLMRF